ncbi:DsbA family protein [Micromonospora sp. NBC_01813]|uniref:DsbA family protein n=1 Tax=Micromonospora sp. NBC_01813 TaxID=2975988 RepID=UPI002DD80F37|nr:thioredoxin domain-containing protein [Micromonospora sp. NBC_01813]WSA10822.1 DsbA family protein [Micromonospora sp. NBC_01813]
MRTSRTSTNTKVTVGLLTVVLAGLVGLFVYVQSVSSAGQQVPAERLVSAGSQRLTEAADGRVTVVEFLDYECPACAAAFPGVEQLRGEYDGQITYVVRNFPLSMHPNARTAALAAEAAARQGKFEEMYIALFQNQNAWSGQQQDQSAVFEGYAEQIGLDIATFRSDMADPGLVDRVQADVDDGTAVGVSGTPTFFVNGERFEGQPTYANLKAAVEAALAE